MERIYLDESFKQFLHGADYNPEQWLPDKSVWDEDMKLMKAAHMNEMSVGIFSWSTLEPREGEYHFEWLDEVLDRIAANGGKVFLATPSAARPHWMADKYPEVLRVEATGVRNHFGHRHNQCPTSPVYREKVRAIDTMLAKRYAKHPALLGWHISNEFNGTGCWCPTCRTAFSEWLRNKYKTIDNLNHEWWSTFWSHTYDSFEQVEPPMPTGESFGGLDLDWKRFTTDITADFIRNEKEAIRLYSDAPTTFQFMEQYTGLNYNRMRSLVDVVSWDSYPEWHAGAGYRTGDQVMEGASTALVHDAYRTFLNKPFVLMECTPSLTNWKEINKLKRPGMNKLSAIQAVAHGADAVQYFQFRKSRGSVEQFHGAVVDHYGGENTRVFKEVAELGITLEKINEVLGSGTKSKVALVMDVENKWALDEVWAFNKGNKKYYETCLRFYYSLWQRGINVDVLESHRDLSSYSLVIAPMLFLTEPDTIANLSSFVKNGGILLSGYMLGMVGENMLAARDGYPMGELKEVFGIWNEEIDSLYPDDKNRIRWGHNFYPVKDYCEIIHPSEGTQVLCTYESDFYATAPALTRHRYGKGIAYYLAARDDGKLTDKLLTDLLREAKVEGVLGGTDFLLHGVTACSREADGVEYIFVQNFNGESKNVFLPKGLIDLESGERISELVSLLPPYGVRIFKRKI